MADSQDDHISVLRIGSTIVVFMVIIIGIITFILQKTEKKWVHYE